MSYLLAPGLQAQQPQNLARLDPNHPLYQDIVFAYSAGRGPHDGRHGPASITGAVTRSVGIRGKRVIPADATSYVNFPASEDYNTLGGVTIIAVIRTTTAIVSQQGLVTRCETGGGANTPWALLMEASGQPALNRSNAGFRVWRTNATLTDNTDYVIAVSQGADISVAPRFYINGAYDTSGTTSLYGGAGSGAPTGNTTSVKLGNRTDLATQSSTLVYDALVVKRVLTDRRIDELSRSISQVWEPEMPLLWFFPGGATIHTLTGSGSSEASSSATGAIAQIHFLTSDNCTEASASGAGAISQIHILAGANSTEDSLSGTGAFQAGQSLSANSSTESGGSGTGALAQVHALAGSSSTESSSSQTATISQIHTLSGSNSTEAGLSGVGSISQGIPAAVTRRDPHHGAPRMTRKKYLLEPKVTQTYP